MESGLKGIRRCIAGAGFFAVFMLGSAVPATAHVDPPGCATTGVHLSFDPSSGLSIVHRNGDHLEIRVEVSNNAAGACTVSGATVSVQLPAADGTPGPVVPVVSNAGFPGGMAETTLATVVPYDVFFEDGVFSGPIKVSFSGTLHDSPFDDPTSGSLSTKVVTSKPHVTLSVTPSFATAPTPFLVPYEYAVTNDSPTNPELGQPTPALMGPASDTGVLGDDICAPLVFTGGDTTVTTPPLLEQGETWTFTCSHLFNDPGTFPNHVSVLGTSTRDGRPWPATSAQGLVTARGPDLTIAKSHAGSFIAGAAGRSYSIVVSNVGNEASSGPISVKDALPPGLVIRALSGAGWSCDTAVLTCNRSDSLSAGSSYPPIAVGVDVALDAPFLVTNVATVSGGGETTLGNNSAGDATTILRPPNAFTIGKRKRNRDGSISLTVGVPWRGVVLVDDAGAFPSSHRNRSRNLVKRTKAIAMAAGKVVLRLRPTQLARKRLRQGLAVRSRVGIAFEPAGGASASSSARLSFKAKKRK
jgi:hypothetical protein